MKKRKLENERGKKVDVPTKNNNRKHQRKRKLNVW